MLHKILDLTGQVALVTGGSRGIGLATAELLLEAGARVAVVARGAAGLAESAEALAQRYGAARVRGIVADVAVGAQVGAAFHDVMTSWSRLDILVNNAGLIHFGAIESIAPDDWDAVIGANLTGAYHCARAAAPIMREQRSGRIITIASVSAQTGGVSAGVDYAASKGGLLALTKALARDMAPYGVTVNAIAPGQIDADPNLLTPEARARVQAMIPLGRLGEPREVAYAVLFLASPMAAYITGATIDVNGGILKR